MPPLSRPFLVYATNVASGYCLTRIRSATTGGQRTATEITLQAFRRIAASALNVDENFTLTGFEATFRRALHVGLQFSVTGGYHVASYTFINGGQPRTDDYVFVQPGLFYRFTDRLQAGLTYQYRRNESNLERFSFSNNQVTAEIALRF